MSALSGGERNRLLLARLFARPANLLVLDEPTNDLDIDTLELLEQLLQDYSGTVLIVSHDRTFLDNVVTQSIVFEGDGKLTEIVGGYADWQMWKAQQAKAAQQPAGAKAPSMTASPKPAAKSSLSYKEARELEALPGQIQALEAEQGRLPPDWPIPCCIRISRRRRRHCTRVRRPSRLNCSTRWRAGRCWRRNRPVRNVFHVKRKPAAGKMCP